LKSRRKGYHVALYPITGIGICAGVGWLDIAARLAWEYHGFAYHTLAFCERDAYAASVLLARMEDTSLERAAICDSIEDLDERFSGVDCVVAGFPCTDISNAGKRQGITSDTRSGLFFEIMRSVRNMGCRWILLENVAAITTLGLDLVLAELAEAGFDAEWMCLRASDVGANHRRDRWFCVVHRPQRGCRELREPSPSDGFADGSDARMGDPDGARRPRHQQHKHSTQGPTTRIRTMDDASHANSARERQLGNDVSGTANTGMDDASSERLQRILETRPTTRATIGTNGIFAPGPADPQWANIIRQTPWLAPAIEPHVHRVPDGGDSWVDDCRADKLRCVGNGVVVLQAAIAFAKLLGRIIAPTESFSRR